MMDFSPETTTLERANAFLKEVLRMPLDRLNKKQTKELYNQLTAVIDDIYYIDDLMPLEEFAEKFTDKKDRENFFHVLDLLEESFRLLDELLGPEEDWENIDEESIPQSTRPADAIGSDDPLSQLLKSIKPNRHAS